MAESLPIGSDGSALNEKVVPAAVRSFLAATNNVASTDTTQHDFSSEDGTRQQMDANGNGRAGVSTRESEDERGVQQPSQANDMEVEPNSTENLNIGTYRADNGGTSAQPEPAAPPSVEHPSGRHTTPQATPAPAPAASLLPPTILPAICQLLLVYIRHSTVMTPIQHPTDTAALRHPSPAGQEAVGQQPQQQPGSISAVQQSVNGVDPPALTAVRQLRIFDIPATLLLQAAAHLMVVGAILPAHYKAVQAELAPHVLPILPGLPPWAEREARPPASVTVAAVATASSALPHATTVATDPAAHAAASGGPGPPAGVDDRVRGEAGADACATGEMPPGVTPLPPLPSTGAITANGGLAAGSRPTIGHVGAHAPTDAVASMWVGQGARPSPQRLGLGRRLFTAIAEQLPKNTELDSILPPLYGYSGVLYRIMGKDYVGAALWDGGVLRDLGSYSTAADARQSMLMTTRLVAAGAAAAVPRPKPAPNAEEIGKVAAREVAVSNAADMTATTGVATAAADVETGARAEAVVGNRAGARAEQGQDAVEPEVAEAAEQLLLLRMAQEAAPLEAPSAGRLTSGPQSQSQSQPADREQRQQRQSKPEDRQGMLALQPQQPVQLPLEQSPLQQQQPGAAAVAGTVTSAALRVAGGDQANAAVVAPGSKGPLTRALSEDVQQAASRLAAAAAVAVGGGADASTSVAMSVDAAPVASRHPRGPLQAAQQRGPTTGPGARPPVAMPPPGEGSPRLLPRADAAAGAAAAANASSTLPPPARNPVMGPGGDSQRQLEPLSRTSDIRMPAMSPGGPRSAGSRTQAQRGSQPQQQLLQQMQQLQQLRYQQQKLQQQKQKQKEYQQHLQHRQPSQHQHTRPSPMNSEKAPATAAGATAPAPMTNALGAAAGTGPASMATRKRLAQSEAPSGRLVRPDSPHAVSTPGEPAFEGASAAAAPSGKASAAGATTVVAAAVGSGNGPPDSAAVSAADREGQLLLDLLSRSQSLPSDLSREALAVLINSTEGLAALLALLQRAKPPQQPQATVSRGFADGDPVPSAPPMVSAPTERGRHPEEEEEWATAAASQNMRVWKGGAQVAPPRHRYYAAHSHAGHAPAIMSPPQQQAHQQQLHHGLGDPGTQAAAHAYELLPMQRVFRMGSGNGLGNGNDTSRKYRDEILRFSLADDLREASCSGSAGVGGVIRRPAGPRTHSNVAATVDGEPSPAMHETVLVLGPRGSGVEGTEQQRGGDGAGTVGRSQPTWTITQRNGSSNGGSRGCSRVPVEDFEPELLQGHAVGASAAPSGLNVGGGGLLLMQTPGGYTASHVTATGRATAAAAAGPAMDFSPSEHPGMDDPEAGAGGCEGRRTSSSATAPLPAAATSQLLARSTLIRSGPSGDSGGGGGASRYGSVAEPGNLGSVRMPRRRYPQEHSPVLGNGGIGGSGSVYQQNAMAFADRAQRPFPPNALQPVSHPTARESKPSVRDYSQFLGSSDGRGSGGCVGGGISHGRSAGAAYSSLLDTTSALYPAQHQRQISTSLPSYGTSHVDFGISMDECGRLQGHEPAPEASAEECEGVGGSAATAAPGGAMVVRLGDAIEDETTSTDVSGNGNGAGGRRGGDGGNIGADVQPQAKRPRHAHVQSAREYGGVTNLMGLGIQEALALFQRHGTQL